MEENTYMILNEEGNPIAQAVPLTYALDFLRTLVTDYCGSSWTLAPWSVTSSDDNSSLMDEEVERLREELNNIMVQWGDALDRQNDAINNARDGSLCPYPRYNPNPDYCPSRVSNNSTKEEFPAK